jgi:hypothetical protein
LRSGAAHIGKGNKSRTVFIGKAMKANEIKIDLQFIATDHKDIPLPQDEMLQIEELDFLAMQEADAAVEDTRIGKTVT